jgi:exopolysaccharide biosynthesis predicted pyruvyltransferase EpsI
MTNSLLRRELFEPVSRLLYGKRIKFFRTPGNVGDDLIDIATRNFFHETATELCTSWDDAELWVHCGGGSLGSLYAQHMYDRIAQFYEAQRRGIQCVILPQSFTGGTEELPPDTIVFAREHRSQEHIPGSILVPDMALSFGFDRLVIPSPKFGSGTFLRNDPEVIQLDRPNQGDPAAICSNWQEYFLLAASYEHIITNRLHFAVGALMAGRRTTLLPNSYYKNRAMYESWLADLGCEWEDS